MSRTRRKALKVLEGPAPLPIQSRPHSIGDTKRPPVKMKRLNLNLPEPLYCDLEELAASTGKTMTEIVKAGLGLANLVYRDLAPNERLTIADGSGRVVKEIRIIA